MRATNSAARLQYDVMGNGTPIVARTDSQAATLLGSSADPRDHFHILVILCGAVEKALRARELTAEVNAWTAEAELLSWDGCCLHVDTVDNILQQPATKAVAVEVVGDWSAERASVRATTAR
jgi:isocitrate lyase